MPFSASVLSKGRAQSLVSKQTASTVKVLEKQISLWSASALSSSNEDKKVSAKALFKKSKKAVSILDDNDSTGPTRANLTDVPTFLRNFSEVACATIKTDI